MPAYGRDKAKPSFETAKLIYRVAKRYNINAQDLVNIAYTESRFNNNSIRYNKNGTIDVGMFQINSVHWTTTCSKLNIYKLEDNAACAAIIISKLKAKHSIRDKQWLGRYHSATKSKKLHYLVLLNAVALN